MAKENSNTTVGASSATLDTVLSSVAAILSGMPNTEKRTYLDKESDSFLQKLSAIAATHAHQDVCDIITVILSERKPGNL